VPDDPAPRIGHAEREETAERLREAAGLGRIDLDELDERLERAYAARTQPELDALVADLRPQRGAVARPSSAVPVSGHRPDDPLVLAAGAGSVKRKGHWELPPWVKISPAMGSVKIDCREAVVLSDVVEVEVVGSMGSATIVVPEGWAANVDRVSPGLGSLKNKLPTVAEPGCPTLVLRGQLGAGTVRLRHANWWERRQERA
jgi:hypothetical protein